jgi:hypothetical protein
MSTALGRSARRLPGRGVIAKAACVVAYVALAWLFGGTLGLVVGVAVVLSRWAFGFAASWLWIGSVGALTAACVATIVQGLPSRSVVGPDFGEHHIAAHVLVGVSLALAAFAGLLEADRTRWRRPRRHRLVAAQVARRGSGVAVSTTVSSSSAAVTPSTAVRSSAERRTGPQTDLRPPDAPKIRPERGRLLPAVDEAPAQVDEGLPAEGSPPAATRPPARRRPRGPRPTGRGRPAKPSPGPPPDPGTEQPPRP